MYLEYAWELVQQIEQVHRNEMGYYGIEYYDGKCKSAKVYLPQSFFSQTLKYLYLTFTDQNVFQIDHWIFSHNGDPLPVIG